MPTSSEAASTATKTPAAGVAEEQPVVDRLFGRLDDLRAQAAERRDRALRTAAAGTPQARTERDAFVALYHDRVRQLNGNQDGLVFGRLDRDSTGRQYIGRLGLHDEEHRQLLVDWRAPAARDFYQATAANPGEVRRRRHIKVRNRTVVDVQDDLLTTQQPPPDAQEPPALPPLVGEAALLAAVNEARSGRMRDIVVTLQAEQDRIIRSPLRGVLVVQGAPGTGKTAVALHRAAYLLYTHRGRLGTSGVLILGPNDRFLRYIEDVLPSLGETSVVSTTLTGLYPAVNVHAEEPAPAAALKGDLRMARVLRRAVQLRRRTPQAPIALTVGDVAVMLTPETVRNARSAAQRTADPHNQAREEFCRVVLDDLLQRLATATGELLDAAGRRELLRMLHSAPDVRREVNLCWMPLHPERLLARLWSDPDALAEAAGGVLTARERRMLCRAEMEHGWSPADIPLLDELAEHIGAQPASAADRATRHRQQAEEAEQVRFARESLAGLRIDQQAVSAELLASRYRAPAAATDLVERAVADRSWVYGHVVVDEAQELSQMAWRMVVRRCPTRSMTVVGDVDQTTSPGGAVRWADVFDVHAPGSWRQEDLTVNYRTPGRVIELADQIIGRPTRSNVNQAAPERRVRSLRPGSRPAAVQVPTLDGSVIERISRDVRSMQPEGTVAVIVADPGNCRRRTTVGSAWAQERLRTGCGEVPVFTAVEAKGLEFDTVLVAEPAEYLELGDEGRRQLYVALTRPTQRLVVVHHRPLPNAFHSLVDSREFDATGSSR
jgi:DNA helicase IV